MSDHRTSDLCGPMLRPCEGCGGMADYARAVTAGFVVARCTLCGRSTGPRASAESAARDWNHRITGGARVVTLFELRSLDFDMVDDAGYVAAWLEERGGALRAVMLEFDIDLGEPVTYVLTADARIQLTHDQAEAEGREWRLWDKKPTAADRAAASWGARWKEARILRGEEAAERLLRGEGMRGGTGCDL